MRYIGCMYVEGVESYFDLWPLKYTLTYIIYTRYGWKALSVSFPKLFFRLKIGWILRKLWAKMLWVLIVYFQFLPTPLTYIAFDQLFIVQYSISHLWHLWHQSVCLIHSIYILESNLKYSNYMKFWFLIISFELQQTLK